VLRPAGAALTGVVALAAEISEDRQHCAIAAGWREQGARVVAELVWYSHPVGAVARMTELWAKHDPVAVVVDGRSQAATLIGPLAEAGIVAREPSAQDLAVAHGEFLDLVRDGRLRHLDQPELTAAVRGAQQRALAGAQAWERRVAVDQSALVSATLAVWGFLRWEELATPGVWAV
jgi:hypothetical protein